MKFSLHWLHPVLSFSVNCRPQDEGDNANNLSFIALSENQSGCGGKLSQKKKIIIKSQEENGLGTIGVWHDQCHTAYKVLFRHVVGHSKPASVSNKKPFKPRRVCGTALVPGNTFQVFVPGRAGARTKQAKINLMACICPCSEAQINKRKITTTNTTINTNKGF